MFTDWVFKNCALKKRFLNMVCRDVSDPVVFGWFALTGICIEETVKQSYQAVLAIWMR